MDNCLLNSKKIKTVFYTRIQALVWKANGLVLPQQLQKDAVTYLLDLLQSINYSKNTLLIDFKNVISIDDYALDTFFEAVNNFKIVVVLTDFVKVDADIRNYLNRYKDKKIKFHESKGLFIFNSLSKPNSHAYYEELTTIIQAEFVTDTIQACFHKHNKWQRLPSTYLRTNAEYDSLKIISNPKCYLWTMLFMNDLFDEVKKNVFIDSPGKRIKLLAVSLKAAPFAATLGLLSKTQFSTIDHLGPRHKLFDVDFLQYHEPNIKYVYIGDFMAGGTEMKIAQTYAQINNCSLNDGLVIATYLNCDEYLDFKIMSLANMKKLNKNYKIVF